jgi:hypothetical protein
MEGTPLEQKFLLGKVASVILSTAFSRWNEAAELVHEAVKGYILIAQDIAAIAACVIGAVTIYGYMKKWKIWDKFKSNGTDHN